MRYCFAWNLKHTQGLTLRKTAEILGVSVERARQLILLYERRNAQKLRKIERDKKAWMDMWAKLVVGEAILLNESLNRC